MQYKTIVLELIEQKPELHSRLRADRMLLETVNSNAKKMKSSHEFWIESLSRRQPLADPYLIRSEAMELAVHEFQNSLALASSPNEIEPHQSLDLAMEFLRRPTPPA